jgi:D-xylose transport system permease protein
VSTAELPPAPPAPPAPTERSGIVALPQAYITRVKAGDVGSLPVILGMVLIVAFFTAQSSVFLTAVNFNNLIVQMCGTTILAMGVVFVLLLGEIDLSIGYVSGVAGVACAWLQEPGTNHQVPGIIAIIAAVAVGALIGLLQGSFVALIGVPSFVVTLAGLLFWQGVIIRWIGDQGVIGIQDNIVNDVANYVLSPAMGWLFAGLLTAGFAANVLAGVAARRRAGLPAEQVGLTVLRVVFVGIVAFGAVAISNRDRGLPFPAVLMVVLLIFWTFIARRTTFGRHIYAVGGSAEAARRAGINVPFIRIVVFMICSGMAGLGGVYFAARLNSVDLTAGGGTILLDAIAAAVIGGTSLFGGRGRVVSALLGSLVIATIANGLSLIGSSAATQYMTTGIILLAAVTLDTVSRRRLAAAGR